MATLSSFRRVVCTPLTTSRHRLQARRCGTTVEPTTVAAEDTVQRPEHPLRRYLEAGRHQVWEEVSGEGKELPSKEAVAHTFLKVRLFNRLLAAEGCSDDEKATLEGAVARLSARIPKNVANKEARSTPSPGTEETDRQNVLVVLRFALKYGNLTQMTYSWLMQDIIDVYGAEALDPRFLVGMLIRSGLLGADENLILTANAKALVPPEWYRDVQYDAATVPDTCEAIREDIPQRMYAIDAPSTFEVDDAISVDGNGWYSVHVADVSRYLPYESSVREAAARIATTVYFPEVVLTMLPRAIIDAATLRSAPDECLCVSVRFKLAENGDVSDAEVYTGRTNSCYRITYTQVNSIMREAGEEGYADCPVEAPPEWFGEDDRAAILDLGRMSRQLRKRRMERKALAISRAEWWPQVTQKLDPEEDGTVVVETTDNAESVKSQRSVGDLVSTDGFDIAIQVRSNKAFDSNKIVEEFMLMAGHSVAAYCEREGVPCAYRVTPNHAESLADGGEVLPEGSEVRLAVPEDVEAGETYGSPEAMSERGYAKLRTQKAAFYSSVNIGHVAVQTSYSHFTSPLRRYPDLLVHYHVKEELLKRAGAKVSADQVEKSSNLTKIMAKVLPRVCQKVSNTSAKKKKMMKASTDTWLLRHVQRVLADDPDAEFQAYIGGTYWIAGSQEHGEKGEYTHCSTAVLVGYGLISKVYHMGEYKEGMVVKTLIKNLFVHGASFQFALQPPEEQNAASA